MPCGYEYGADLPCMSEQAVCQSILFVARTPFLFVGCSRRSRGWKSDPDVARQDPFFLMLFSLSCAYCYGVSQRVRVKEIYT